jgi:putative membrane protein insertion efficiency factor
VFRADRSRRLPCSVRSVVVHVRPRSSRLAAAGGLCDRPRRRPGCDAQSDPSSPASHPAPPGSAATSGFVSFRGSPRRRRTVVQRTHVRRSSDDGQGVTTRFNQRLIAWVRWYQRGAEGRPSPCRFSPSCSCYAVEALETHGSRRGLWLTVRRLARCRPFGPSGFDPVPDRIDRSSPDLLTSSPTAARSGVVSRKGV